MAMVIDFAALTNLLEREANGLLDETETLTLDRWRASRDVVEEGLPGKDVTSLKAAKKDKKADLLESIFGN